MLPAQARPSYTSKTVFDSFPWPQAPAQAVVDRVVEVVADRVVEVVAELLAFRAERMVQGITFANSTTRCASPAAADSATSTRHSTGLCWTCTGSTPARTYSPRSSH
jgi:hypothetical protein